MKTLQEIYDFASRELRQNGNPYGTPNARFWGNINPENLSERCVLARMCTGNEQELKIMAIDFSEIVHHLFDKTCGTGSKEYKFCVEIAGAFDLWNSVDNKELILKDIAKRYELKYRVPEKKTVPQREPVPQTEEAL